MMIHKFSEQNIATYVEDAHMIIKIHAQLVQLKNLYRQGWIKVRGVAPENAESVADHSFVVAMLALAIAREHRHDLDVARVTELALLHDVCEVYAGDITPADGDEKKITKRENEDSSFDKVFADLEQYDHFMILWAEYRAQDTPEALFVHNIDKLEFVLQASLYKKMGHGTLDLAQIKKYAASQMNDDALLSVLEEIEVV